MAAFGALGQRALVTAGPSFSGALLEDTQTPSFDENCLFVLQIGRLV